MSIKERKRKQKKDEKSFDRNKNISKLRPKYMHINTNPLFSLLSLKGSTY